MNSPRNRPFDPLPGTQDAVDAQIEDYLDFLCAPLLGIVPYPHRRRLRLEAADHLHTLAEDHAAEGVPPDEAVAAAQREYGNPWQVGQSFADAWSGRSASPHFSRFADAATQRAFGWFGVFSVASLLLIEYAALGPHPEWLTPWVQCLAVLSPLLAGTMTGLGLNSRTPLGICRAVPLLALVSAAAGLLLRPSDTGLQFAAFQLVFWLPAGCLSASVAAGLRRHVLLRGFHRHTTR